jgi:hypothetical protein
MEMNLRAKRYVEARIDLIRSAGDESSESSPSGANMV